MRDWWKQVSSLVHHFWTHRRRMFARAFKDKRQRLALLVTFGAVLYVTIYAIYLVRNPAAAVLLVLGMAVAAFIRRSHRREDETFTTLIAPSPAPLVEENPNRSEDEKRVLLLWLLYGRALSELTLQNRPNILTEQVATRSVLLARIRELGLDESFTDDERDLHFSPDGGWTSNETVGVITRGAELEVLLWASGKRSALVPIEDLNRVVAIPALRKDDLTGPMQFTWLDSNDIRAESHAATGAWLRLLTEMERRGIANVTSIGSELHSSMKDVAAEGGNQSTDLVLGTKLVTECSDAELRIAFEQTTMRNVALSSLIDANLSEPNDGGSKGL